jgi:hypothetical protein
VAAGQHRLLPPRSSVVASASASQRGRGRLRRSCVKKCVIWFTVSMDVVQVGGSTVRKRDDDKVTVKFFFGKVITVSAREVTRKTGLN